MSDANALLLSWIDTPYVLGGSLPTQGMDCVGLIIAYARLKHIYIQRKPYGYRVRSVVLQSEISRYATYIRIEDMQNGDILIFRPGHLGIFMGESRFIHVTREMGVVLSNLQGKWLDRLLSVWRLYESE